MVKQAQMCILKIGRKLLYNVAENKPLLAIAKEHLLVRVETEPISSIIN